MTNILMIAQVEVHFVVQVAKRGVIWSNVERTLAEKEVVVPFCFLMKYLFDHMVVGWMLNLFLATSFIKFPRSEGFMYEKRQHVVNQPQIRDRLLPRTSECIDDKASIDDRSSHNTSCGSLFPRLKSSFAYESIASYNQGKVRRFSQNLKWRTTDKTRVERWRARDPLTGSTKGSRSSLFIV